MMFESLLKSEIYTIPIGDYCGVEPERIQILYAPLVGQALVVSEEELVEIEKLADGKSAGNSSRIELLKRLKESRNLFVFEIPKNSEDIYEVDLLSNFTCNFSCSYCYSAKGRSAKEVSFEHIKTVIDHLFLHKKSQKRPYKINFSGGGEPLLSFPLIKKTVDYIEEKVSTCSLQYSYGLVTNGSLLTPEIIDFIKEQKINLVVSFEILKEFQNLERGNYAAVARNIDLLLEKECPFGIRATITPVSVRQMGAMIEELVVRFPKLKSVVFDTVLSADIFKTPQELSGYYRDFSKEYWRAKELGAKLGIEIGCNAVEFAGMLRERTCQGKLVLTPDGAISSCARVSSPKEALYNEFIYGKADYGELIMDEGKLTKVMQQNNIFSREECRNCYARWNCGGGCLLFTLSFPKEFEEPFCNFTRDSLKKTLFEMLDTRHFKIHGKHLRDYIKTLHNE
jgi:radical SAM protein with 4Fe4S-binding SPASM domain